MLGFIALSGYIYYCYKFGNPDLGNNDFYRYKEMVERPFDLNVVPAPFVLRQIPTVVAHLFYVFGIFYDTKTNLDIIIPGADATKRIFFALILSNALAVGVSFAISLRYIREKTLNNNVLICFSYIGIVLSYFYFPSSVIAPLTTGWGWFASAILAIALIEKKLLLVCVGLIALVTRETVLIFSLAFSIVAWASFGRWDRFYLRSAVIIAASCAALIFARTYLVHGYEHQIDLQAVVTNILSFRPSREFVFQVVIPQALIFVLLVSLAKSHSSYALALFLSMIAVTIAAIGIGVTAIGRDIGETLPFYAIILLLSKLGGLTPAYADRSKKAGLEGEGTNTPQNI